MWLTNSPYAPIGQELTVEKHTNYWDDIVIDYAKKRGNDAEQ
jgi:hypothetical protein